MGGVGRCWTCCHAAWNADEEGSVTVELYHTKRGERTPVPIWDPRAHTRTARLPTNRTRTTSVQSPNCCHVRSRFPVHHAVSSPSRTGHSSPSWSVSISRRKALPKKRLRSCCQAQDGLRLPEFLANMELRLCRSIGNIAMHPENPERPTHSRRGLATTCLLHPALPGHAGGHQERLPDQNPTTK